MAGTAARRKHQFAIAPPKTVAVPDSDTPSQMELNETLSLSVVNFGFFLSGHIRENIAHRLLHRSGSIGWRQRLSPGLCRKATDCQNCDHASDA